MHEHVSEYGRLDRAGEDGATAGVGGELIEQHVARAAADDVDDFDASPVSSSIQPMTVAYMSARLSKQQRTSAPSVSGMGWLVSRQ